jgi:FkbM family methyltransferase
MADGLLGSLLRRVWPARSVDRLLRTALLEDLSAATVAWRAFETSADFDHLSPGEMRLIALVSKRLGTLAPNSPMRARIGGIERAQWSRSQLVIAEAGEGLRALEAERVSMLVIDGASRAAASGAPTRGLAISAVDLVVQPDDLEKAFDLLTGSGWQPAGSWNAIHHRTRLTDLNDLHLVRGRFGHLGLHRTAWRPLRSEASGESIWQRSAPGLIAGANVRVPCATDAIAIALAHGVLDGHESGDCLADVAARIDSGVNWELFGSIADGHRLCARGALVLRYARERLERPVPESVLRALEGQAIRHPLPILAALARSQARGAPVGLLKSARAVARRVRARLATPRPHGRPPGGAKPGLRETRRRARYYLLRSVAAPIHFIRPLAPGWTALNEIADRLSFVRSRYGPYLLNTPGDRTFELCVQGYGPFVADCIVTQNRPFVFLDIGASLGVFSLLAARNPHCERVIAVEPLPDTFARLQANIRRNGATAIEPILGAVTETTDPTVYLSFDARHSGRSRIVDLQHGSVRAPVISAEALDGLFPAPPRCVVAKIDVEGSEVDVLSTLRRTRFYNAITEVIIEVSELHLGSAKRSLLLTLLAQDGFEELSRAGAPDHYDARYRRVRLGDGREP